MDADIVAGTRSDAQAAEFFQRRAIPKQLHRAKPSDLVKFPTSTVQQVIQRQRAEQAATRGFPPSVNGVDADLIAKAQGIEGARRKAAGRIDFDAYAQHQTNIANIMAHQEQTRRGKEVLGATADVMNLGQALGSAHDELKPQTRADIEHHANQLRSLVGSKTVDAHLAGGRALQAAYAARNQNLYDNDAIYRSIMIAKSRENAIGRGSGGSEPAGRVASDVSVPGRAATYAPGPLSSRSARSAASIPVSSGPLTGSSTSSSSLSQMYNALDNPLSSFLAGGDPRLSAYGPSGRRAVESFLGREAFDTGYLEAPQ